MSVLPTITLPAPEFTSEAVYPNKEIKPLSLTDYRGKWVVLFWYPLDFTFVCPTEIIAYGDRQDEFDAINTQLIAASCDSSFTHLAWINTPRSEGGLGDMKIPIVADFNKSVATKYGVLVPNDGVPFRALFIISPEGILRQITVNDLPVGRNVDETIRLVKAFQFTDKYGEVCPANWQPGDKTMAADPEKSKDYFRAVNPAPGIPAASAPLEEVEDPAKLASIIASPTLTVVDFWAPWCRNCSKILPAVTRLAGTYTGAKFVKVNTVAAEAIAIEKGADVLPTFQFYKNGTKIGQFTGSDIAGLEAAIASYL